MRIEFSRKRIEPAAPDFTARVIGAVKARIGGMHGHLNNDDAAAILDALDRSKLRHVVAAHLSQQNNLPALAQAALAAVLGGSIEDVMVATQDDGFAWLPL